MKVQSVTVKVGKMFSDSNYGHQDCEVSYAAEVGEYEDPEQITVMLLARATAQVRVQLGASETLNIRRAVNPRPRVCGHCSQPLGDWDNYTHRPCEEIARNNRDAKREAVMAAYRHDQLSAEILDGSDLGDEREQDEENPNS